MDKLTCLSVELHAKNINCLILSKSCGAFQLHNQIRPRCMLEQDGLSCTLVSEVQHQPSPYPP